MNIKKRLVFSGLILVFFAVFCNAIDLSTPSDGNLYTINKNGFIPNKSVIYRDITQLEQSGLKAENGRIFRPLVLSEIYTPSIENIFTGSNPAFTSKGDMVVLTGNNSRYNHGIFGKRENATGFAVIKNGIEIAKYELERDSVFETLRPMIVDLVPENSGEEILLTVSDKTSGSRISVFSLEGKLLGSSEAIGQGYRWLHLLSVSPFGSDSVKRVTLVRTPHIGGILQVYEWQQSRLVMVASKNNLSTHQIGSDNLNMAVVSDFDGREGSEMILPANNYTELVVVKYEDNGISIINRFPLPGRLNTNIYFDNGVPSSIWVGTENGYFVNIRAK